MHAVVDPAGPKAAYVGAVLEMLRESLHPHLNIRIVLNPQRRLTDVPIKSFYRYVGIFGQRIVPSSQLLIDSLCMLDSGLLSLEKMLHKKLRLLDSIICHLL